MQSSGFYGWKLLAVLWIVTFINLGFPAYGQTVINSLMALDLHFDRATLGLLFSAYIGMTGVGGPVSAMLVNRIGVRRTLMVGSGLIILGSTLMATVVSNPYVAAAALGLLIGSGVSIGGALTSQAGVARWFLRRRALALSILYSAGALGGFVVSPLMLEVINAADGNWRTAWWVMAALSAVAAVLALLFVCEQPADLGQVPDGVSDKGNERARPVASFITTEPWTLREALASPVYWFMVTSLIGGSCGYTLYLAQGFVHLTDLGHSREVGAWSVSILAGMGILAKVVLALLGDRIDPRYLWAGFTAFFALGLYLVIDARSDTQVFAFAASLGLGFGGGVVCLMAVLSNYYGIKVFPSLAGIAVAVNTLSSVAAPYVAGRLYDIGYGYRGSFLTFSVWCLAGAIVLFALRPPTRRVPQLVTAEVR
ncbi:MAG TPA: MFS transporter [Steroidobacteraceae bacterium]|nr:MFS transporter [Steroidobacteraceae bacterium]